MTQTSKSNPGKRTRVGRALGVATKLAATAAAARGAGGAKVSVSALVAAQLPGWKLAPDSSPPTQVAGEEDGVMKSEHGPSINQLRRKFLGDDAADGAADSSDIFADVDESRETVRVEPRRGGPAKTADIKNGKVSIVQG
jgi:hypothetical protein